MYAINLQNRKIFAFFIQVYHIFTNLSRRPHNYLRCRALQQQLTAFANNQNKYKTPEQYYVHTSVTIISYRVLRRGEKHAQKYTSVKDGNVRLSSNFAMLGTDLENFFSAIYLLTCKPVCRSLI